MQIQRKVWLFREVGGQIRVRINDEPERLATDGETVSMQCVEAEMILRQRAYGWLHS